MPYPCPLQRGYEGYRETSAALVMRLNKVSSRSHTKNHRGPMTGYGFYDYISCLVQTYIMPGSNSSQYHIVKGPSLLTISAFGHKSWKPVVKLAETTHFPRVKTHHFSESGLLVKSCDPRTHVFLLQLPTTQPQQE